jgi:hypothetical protein
VLERRRLRAKSILRWGRRLALVLAAIGLGILVRKVDVMKLDPGITSLDGAVREGATLVLMKVGDRTNLGPGAMVEVLVEDGGKGNRKGILSRIAAGPGTEISFGNANRDGLVPLLIDGKPSGYDVLPRVPIPEGEIPDGWYLVLNPSLAAHPLDSRTFGLFRRQQILRKIVVAF